MGLSPQGPMLACALLVGAVVAAPRDGAVVAAPRDGAAPLPVNAEGGCDGFHRGHADHGPGNSGRNWRHDNATTGAYAFVLKTPKTGSATFVKTLLE